MEPITETATIEESSSSASGVPNESAPVLVEEDTLVEEISIDGMCGVY